MSTPHSRLTAPPHLGFAPLARRLGWRPEFPWARLTDWAAKHGGVTLAERRQMPPMGIFADPFLQIVKRAALLSGTPARSGRFSSHADEPVSLTFMPADCGARDGERAGPAGAYNAAGPDRTATAGACRRLFADAAAAGSEPCGAGGNDHRSVARAPR